MAFEPICIFSRKIDPRGVAELLRSSFETQIDGPEDDWSQIVVTVRKGGLLRKPKLLTFGHDSGYYDGEDWPQQVMEMQSHFSQFPETPNKREVLRLIGTFRFSLAVPQEDLDIDSTDERLAVLYAVCRHLDGVIFTPSSLRDANGRILYDSDGEADPNAVMPAMPPVSDAADENQESGDGDEEEYQPDPPPTERVARRAMALTAVAARATLEFDAEELEDPEFHRGRLLDWLKALEIDDELEPQEWKVLQRPVGSLEPQDHINAMWRVEGLTVLAWALGLHELPPDDELIVPMELYDSLGIFDADKSREILQSAELRPAEELQEMRNHLLMLHWRLRNYSLRPEPMDFAEFSKDCWFCSFDINTFRLIGNDLAIGDAAIGDADPDEVGKVQSIAMERHLAINWLTGDSEIYSETETNT